MTEAPRERDPLPRHGDPLEEQVADERAAVEPAAQPLVSESSQSAYAVPEIERPGVNDASGATDEAIAHRAYELYQARGGSDGADMDDWLRAEQELQAGSGPADEREHPVHRPID